MKVILDEELRDGYEAYVAIPDKVAVVPTEYYTYQWLGFSGNPIKNARYLPDASLIDASTIRLQSGTDYYMQQLLDRHLDPTDRIELSRAYRSLRETFDGFDVINAKLAADQGAISRRQLSLSIDLSSRAAWERTLVPHLDHLPFQCVGKGEQSSLKIMLALNRDGDVGFPS